MFDTQEVGGIFATSFLLMGVSELSVSGLNPAHPSRCSVAEPSRRTCLLVGKPLGLGCNRMPCNRNRAVTMKMKQRGHTPGLGALVLLGLCVAATTACGSSPVASSSTPAATESEAPEPTPSAPTPSEPGDPCDPYSLDIAGVWVPLEDPSRSTITFLADGSGYTPTFEWRVEDFRVRREENPEWAARDVRGNPFYLDVANYLDGLADWPNDTFLWTIPDDSVLVMHITSVTLVPLPLPNLYAIEGDTLRLLALCEDGDYYDVCPGAETRFYRRALPEECRSAGETLLGSWNWVTPPVPGPTFTADGSGC